MHLRCEVAVVLLSVGMFAQSPPCPADRPVDDIIAEVHQQQSKKKRRNTNPLPSGICIFGWCMERSGKSSTSPESESPTKVSPADNTGSNEKCDEAMDIAIEAAHNVEVGDQYFERENYNAALVRYSDALEGKPGDPAIQVRLGRVLERLNQLPAAVEHYDSAQKPGGPEKWSNEAKSALSRLQRPPRP